MKRWVSLWIMEPYCLEIWSNTMLVKKLSTLPIGNYVKYLGPSASDFGFPSLAS